MSPNSGRNTWFVVPCISIVSLSFTATASLLLKTLMLPENKVLGLDERVNPCLIYIFFCEISTHVLESSPNLAWEYNTVKKPVYKKIHLSSTNRS